jgi:mono/diheme cytochrome c family protein
MIAASASVQAQSPAADGPALFKTYCASCHGVDATGSGPVAPALRHAPPDLTQLAKRNNGQFPSARVRRVIEGREVQAHGDREMPVWGDAFQQTREGRSAGEAEARLAAIIRHLEAIQGRNAQ